MNDILNDKLKFSIDDGYKVYESAPPRGLLPILGDEIYHDWSQFAKPIQLPRNGAERRYTRRQETIRKDIERCFGAPQSMFAILRSEHERGAIEVICQVCNACI